MFILAFIAACSTTTYQSFNSVKNRNVEIAYVAEGADFSKYHRLMPDDMGIFYPTASAPSEADLERIRSEFREAFRARVKDYEIVTQPAPDVIRVSAMLIDLRSSAVPDIPNLSREIVNITRPGQLTFVIEVRDSISNTVLARAADTSKTPRLDLPDDGSADISEVRDAARHWADLFGNFLDHNLRGAP